MFLIILIPFLHKNAVKVIEKGPFLLKRNTFLITLIPFLHKNAVKVIENGPFLRINDTFLIILMPFLYKSIVKIIRKEFPLGFWSFPETFLISRKVLAFP